MEVMVKRYLISLVGSVFSALGIIGVILSTAVMEILLFVITAMSGLFTIAVSTNRNGK